MSKGFSGSIGGPKGARSVNTTSIEYGDGINEAPGPTGAQPSEPPRKVPLGTGPKGALGAVPNGGKKVER